MDQGANRDGALPDLEGLAGAFASGVAEREAGVTASFAAQQDLAPSFAEASAVKAGELSGASAFSQARMLQMSGGSASNSTNSR
jgi:hypothetical protein